MLLCAVDILTYFRFSSKQHVSIGFKAFQSGIKAAMLQYRNSVVMKEMVDHNQFRYQCCGAINYQDWYKIAWTEKHYLDLGNTALVQYIYSSSLFRQ